MRKILTSFSLIAASLAFAQVGVNNDNPKATLHIDAKASNGTSTETDGILIPRVDRARAQAMSTIEESTLIYVKDVATGDQTGKAQNIDATGFYYYKGDNDNGKWIKLDDSSHIKHPVYISTEGSDKVIREYSETSSITYTVNDFMIILTNDGIDGQLNLPDATQNKGRIIWLVNGTTSGLGFLGGNLDRKSKNYPFNFSTIPARGSGGFVSDGKTWYTLTTSR